MKRIFSLLLCLIMACGMLVGCGETVIGEHLDSLKENFYVEPEKKIALKLYIVYDEADHGALQEVERRINAMTEADYNTQLDVVYCTAEEYDDTVMAAAAANEKAIVLINSEELMKKLYGDGTNVSVSSAGQLSVGYLEELTGYIRPTATGDAKYGLLNAKISASLMEASMLAHVVLGADNKPVMVDKTYAHDGSVVTGADGEAVQVVQTDLGLFTIPNNHLIDGEYAYTYLMIDRQACEIWLNHDAEYLKGIVDLASVDALKNELRTVLSANGADPDKADDYVKLIRGSYATKDEIEKGIAYLEGTAAFPAEKYILNVISGPQVTGEDAFSGAFAVLKGTDVDRAMRIIYAINMDSDLHNLLQYGIKDTNYQWKDGNVTRFDTEGKKYIMNLRYTGNVFSALYCADENWTAEIAKYAEAQNKVADREYDESVAEQLELLKMKDLAEKLAVGAAEKIKDAANKEADAIKKEAEAELKMQAAAAAGNQNSALNEAAIQASNLAKTARAAANDAADNAEEATAEAEAARKTLVVAEKESEVRALEAIAARASALAEENREDVALREAADAARASLEVAIAELNAAKEALTPAE